MSSQRALEHGGPLQSLQVREPLRDREKTVWTEGDESLGKLKWKAYPTPTVGGERKDLKSKIPKDVNSY